MINVLQSNLDSAENEILYQSDEKTYTISKGKLKEAQCQDQEMKRILNWKQNRIDTITPEMRKKLLTREGKSLLREYPNLYLHDDNLLVRIEI